MTDGALPEWTPVYTRLDQPGRDYSCRCVLPGRAHPFCAACLILVGPDHVERCLYPAVLPVYTHAFNDRVGVWECGVVPRPARVCSACHAFLARTPERATVRIDPVPRVRRLAVERAWRAAHPDAPPSPYWGRYRRAERYDPRVFAAISRLALSGRLAEVLAWSA